MKIRSGYEHAHNMVSMIGTCLALTLACAGGPGDRSSGTSGGTASVRGGAGGSAGAVSSLSSGGLVQPSGKGGGAGTRTGGGGGVTAASGAGSTLVAGATTGGAFTGEGGISAAAGGTGAAVGSGDIGGTSPKGGSAGTAVGSGGIGGTLPKGGSAGTAVGSGGTAGGAYATGGSAGTTCPGAAVGASDGVWSGTTNDNRSLRFLVTSGQMSFLSITWGKVSCGVTEGTTNVKTSTLSVGPTGAITGTLTSSLHVSINCTVTGQFCGNTISGGLDCRMMAGDCTGAFTSSWSATRLSDPPICGNEVEWPEQCDDGNANDNDGCSSACLLEGTAEKEPNDDGVTAVGEDDFTATPTGLVLIQSDTTVTASLSPAGDEDVFRAFGQSSTTTTRVRIETFGRKGPGTCDVDTVLDLRDSAGQVLATDDDSGVGACSSIEYVIPAAFPIAWVNIHVADKNDDDAISLYFLTVTYL